MRRTAAVTCILLGLLLAGCSRTSAKEENWPHWRGPHGNNHSGERNLPIVWGENHGLLWRAELPEWGNSTPAIWGDAIFVTSHVDDERLVLLRLDKTTGRRVWERQVGAGSTPRTAPDRGDTKFHRLHNLATPSPATDGEVVVAHFGNGDLAVYDFDGELLWKRNLQDDYGPFTIWWGRGNSPMLFGDLVISVCMQDSLADRRDPPVESYLVAHDRRTGRVVWRTLRMTGANAEQCDSYTTPVFRTTDEGTEMIVMGGNQLDAYDPATGERRWRLTGLVGGRTVTGPTVGEGLVYATHGMRGPLVAVRLGRLGDLSHRDVAWRFDAGTPDSVTPVVAQRLLFTVTDDGIARCLDAEFGQLRWKVRLPGSYKATPLVAEGRVFFLNAEGLCTVVSAARQFDKLVENQLDDVTLASPAVSGGRIFIRGHRHLYCIGKPAPVIDRIER